VRCHERLDRTVQPLIGLELINFLLPESYLRRTTRVYRFIRGLVGRAAIVKTILSSLFLSILDFFGFVVLFPFIKLATDDQFRENVQTKLSFLPAVAALGHKEFVALTGVGVILYFVLRAYLHHATTSFQLHVSAAVTSESSRKLINSALSARYQLFLDEGAVRIAGVSYSNSTHASIVFLSVVAIVNEAAVIAIVLASFILVSPIAVLALAGIGALFARLIFLPISKKVAILGRTTHDYDLARHRFIHSMANAVRDIKIMGLEKAFTARNSEIVQRHVELLAEYQSLASVTRLLIEALMMAAVVVACLWFVYSSSDLEDVAPILATLGLAVVRIAPAISRLAASVNTVRFSFPVVETLIDMSETINRYPQPRNTSPIRYAGAYTAREIGFSYGSRSIIDGASLEIPEGGVVAIIGTSGSGKSTLLDLLAGLQQPNSGTFLLDGQVFAPFESEKFNNLIGYVPQNIALLDASLCYNIALEEPADPDRLAAAISGAHLSGLVQSLALGVETVLGDGAVGVSGGQRQRIGIARALYRRPALLILDEVTSALDVDTARDVMDDIQSLRGETTILIVSHDLSPIRADRIYEMVDGRPVERSTAPPAPGTNQ